MSTISYQCPCCGAPLAYDGASGKLACAACGNSYAPELIEAMDAPPQGGGVRFDLPKESFSAREGDAMQAYVCNSCGAELMTDDTTTATECPYCGSPTILPDRLGSGVRPERVVPFVITKEQAQAEFEGYFKGKRLLPNVFLNGRNRIADMRRLYVPYWLFDCDAQASVVYDAERRRVERHGDWEITRTEHYVAVRSGVMGFDGIPVDGSERLRNEITESLEPYDMTAAVPFTPAVLAGAVADHADVDAGACEGRAAERVESSLCEALRDTVDGYPSVSERNRSVSTQKGRVTPVLLPVWLITTRKEDKTYTFAINGQTGQLTCDVPADGAKSLAWGGGVFALVLALCALCLWLAGELASGTLLLSAIGALIAALAVVGVLQGQLRQAVRQSAAHSYVREGSFELTVRNDHFLYETTERRRIEPKQEPNRK